MSATSDVQASHLSGVEASRADTSKSSWETRVGRAEVGLPTGTATVMACDRPRDENPPVRQALHRGRPQPEASIRALLQALLPMEFLPSRDLLRNARQV